MTSASWTSQNRWSTIGFYPDVADAGGFATTTSICAPASTTSNNSSLNEGLTERFKYILDDSGETFDGITTSSLSNLISKTELAKLYVSHFSTKTAGTTTDALTTGHAGGVGKQVELHVQAVQMLDDIENNYAQNHMRDVSYNDYYQFSLKNIASGKSFNHLVSNGISNFKAVLIIPLLNTLNNNVNLFDDGQPQLLGHINNFNVLVGGSNVLHADARYTYQSFNNELYNDFGVNGNQSSGMGSSLIDFKSWLKKPYYYVNCSRVPMEQKNAYRYLQIKGTNSSALAMDYMIFAVYKKNFQLDVMSGNINKIE